MDRPYLSVVVTARNDDHGGNLLGRMQAFVDGLLSQCARHRVPAELVMVEWNPPPDRPPLEQALNWSKANEFCSVRVIEVPDSVHHRLKHAQALPLYQMIAKNVGIRRARGEFILATNIDILFSDELFQILAARALEPGKMYRADRWDVMPDVPVDQPIERQLAWCNTHLLRVNRREGTFPLNPDGTMNIAANDIVSPERGITLGENWFSRELSGAEPFRWVDNDAELIITKPGEVRLCMDIEPGPGLEGEPLSLDLRDPEGAVLASILVDRRSTVALRLAQPSSRVFLHTDYGGARIASDLRTLNFRLFRCELAMNQPSISRPAQVSTTPLTRARRNWGVFRRAFFSTTEIRIPLSKAALERLNLHQDESAVAFMLGPLFRKFAASDPDRVTGGGLTAMWGDGWYDFEHFRGETFRWMRQEGTVTLILPESGASRISLVAEAGPAVGFRGARLEVRNGSGEPLASVELQGRTTLHIPAGGFKGFAILQLSVSGGAEPKAVPGDPRTLALRLIRCELDPPAPRQEPVHLFETAPGTEVWCLRGFKRRASGLTCSTRGEMLLRTAEDVTLLVSPAGPRARMRISDGAGGVLRDGAVSPGEQIAIPGAGCGGLLLRFTTDRPVIFTGIWRGAPEPRSIQFKFNDETSPVHLHTNGCGDFTMMARAHWFDLRGYPEFDAFSMNIDSVLCWAAHHGGAREKMLPARIFHIEHGTGSGWTPEGEEKLYRRITAKGLPWLDFHTVLDWARAMRRFDTPLIFNQEDWGFARETLHEYLPGVDACQQANV